MSLPKLRQDLKLMSGPRSDDGAPTWTLEDPASNKFFRIGLLEFEILTRWGSNDAKKIVDSINKDTAFTIGIENVNNLVEFLNTNNLVIATEEETRQAISTTSEKLDHWDFSKMVKTYLFFKIPLFNPDKFLNACMPFISPLFSKKAMYTILLVTIIGFLLLSRQWEEFKHTFTYFFDAKGMLIFGLTYLVLHVFHEFGHAFTAKHYGLKVPTIGVAFLFMFPVLYTDVTDSWKLKSKQQKLAVGAAGVITELSIAAFATLAWTLLDNGPLRSAAFLITTTSWLTTLLINANIFLRFDGYYLFSDLIGIENLQSRSFEMTRWWFREKLFGFKIEAPEPLPKKTRTLMIIYGISTWVYRLFLYTGIALLVYFLFFKVLGIIIMVLEIIWLLVAPILKEFVEWWTLRSKAKLNRNVVFTTIFFVALILALVTPWQSNIKAPAIIKFNEHLALFTPQPGQVHSVLIENNLKVQEGDILVDIRSPELDFEIQKLELDKQKLLHQLKQVNVTPEWLQRYKIIRDELLANETKLEGLYKDRNNLTLTSPYNGLIVDYESEVKPGTWINTDKQIGIVVDASSLVVEAYIKENDIEFIKEYRSAYFQEGVEHDVIDCDLLSSDVSNTQSLPGPYLASNYGGNIGATVDDKGQLKPNDTIYKIILKPHDIENKFSKISRGLVVIKGQPRSLLSRAWRKVASVLIRESGF